MEAFEEEIEAWQFDPVVHSVYSKYCGFGSIPIEYNFPNSYRLYPNWEVFALTQWKLIR